MSQSAAAPPPPATPAAQPAPAPQAPPNAKPKRSWAAPTGKPVGVGVENTPTLLNRLQVIGMAAVLLFGLASGLVQFLSYQSDGRAADDTEQLVRVQEIQSNLLRVDAIATNLAVSGGNLDPAEIASRDEEYDQALDDVLGEIASAAEAQPADEKALAALNVAVNDYATAIAEARANLRQGYPVGKEYLSGASANLRADALPILTNLVDANTERAEDSMGGQHPIWLLLIGLASVAVLVWISILLAGRFRRYVNVGIAVAMIVVVVTTIVAAIAAWRADSQNDDLLAGELRMAVDQAAVRTAGNDAKANESLRIVNRGSGPRYEDPWNVAAEIVEDKGDRTVLDEWRTYAEAHASIVEYDDEDRRGPAIQIATGAENAPGGQDSTAAFDAFDGVVKGLVQENGATVSEELRAGRSLALVGSLLTLLLGCASAIAVARGIGARRREYA